MIGQNFKLRNSVSNVCKISDQKQKLYQKLYIHDKLDGHTKDIVISDFFQNAVLFTDFQNGFQRFSNVQIFKN